MNGHHSLTDEQFADLLAGRPSTGTLADLHADAGAMSELAEVKSALHSYRAETLVWATRRASATPSLVPAARRRARWIVVPQWSLAAVAVAVVAAGIGHFSGRIGDNAIPSARATATASLPAGSVAAATDIASDNELLSSIDAALSYAGRSPVEGLGLKPAQDNGEQRRNVE